MKAKHHALLVPVAILLAICCLPGRADEKKEGGKAKAKTPVYATGGRLQKKVIVKHEKARSYRTLREVDAAGAGTPHEVFEILFRLYDKDEKEVIENGADKYYYVGDEDGAPIGYIKAEFCIEWNTRSILKPLPKPGQPFKIYAQKKGQGPPKTALDLSSLDEAAKLAGADPDERAVTYILEPPASSKAPAYNVAYFIGKPRTEATRVAKPKPHLRDLKLEVIFVIDTTGSMTPLLEGTKEVVAQVADVLGKRPELKGIVRLGLVEYQDNTVSAEGNLVPARLVKELTDDMADFQKAVKPLKVATISSEEWEEDVLAGLKLAIDKGGWGKKSSRHIVLLGDAGAHLGEFKNTEGKNKNTTGLSIESLISLGRPPLGGGTLGEQLTAINFHSVLAKNGTGPHVDKAKTHFAQIARNNGSYQGATEEVDVNDKASRDKSIANLVKSITEASESVKTAASSDKKELELMLTKAKDLPGNEGAMKRAVFELALSNTPPPGVKFLEGWAAERVASDRVAEEYLMVTKRDLLELQGALDYFHTILKDSTSVLARRNNKKLLQQIRRAAATVGAGEEVGVMGDTSLENLLRDLPLKPDVLRITPDALASMTVEDFGKWLRSLKSTSQALENIHKDTSWNRTGDGAAGGKGTDKKVFEYKFMRLSDLP